MPTWPSQSSTTTTPRPRTQTYGAFGGTRGSNPRQYIQNPETGEMEPDPNWTGRYGTHVPGTGIDAGNRRVGSVDYNAFGNLQNFLGQTGQQGADYLRSMGIEPSYNGRPLSEAMNAGPTRYDSFTETYGSGGRGQMLESRQAGMFDGGAQGTPAYGTNFAGSPFPQQGPLMNLPAARGGASGGAPGIGGGGGSVGGAGGLEEQLSNAYGGIIGQGGRSMSGADEALLANRTTDSLARATNDRITDARLDAVRRGDTSGSSLGSVENEIRARGASDQNRARNDIRLGLSQQAIGNLLQALGGAGGYIGNRREAEILLGQLQSQGGLGGGLQLLLGGG